MDESRQNSYRISMSTGLLLLLGALITASGQLLLKRGSQIIERNLVWPGGYTVIQWVKSFFTIIFEPHIFTAFVLYFLGSLLWLKILTRADLSYLYPILIGLTILVTSIFSFLLFKETFTALKISGIVLVITGIAFIFSNY